MVQKYEITKEGYTERTSLALFWVNPPTPTHTYIRNSVLENANCEIVVVVIQQSVGLLL